LDKSNTSFIGYFLFLFLIIFKKYLNNNKKKKNMVLESIINPLKAEKEPWEMLVIGFIYCSVAILLSLWIFEGNASLVMVFLTVLASVPLMYSTIKMEEEKDLKMEEEKALIKEHGKALSFFVFLFLGITTAVV